MKGRECQALESAANVGWALLPDLSVGGSRQQAGSARVSWHLGSRFLCPHPSISPVGLGSLGQNEVGSGAWKSDPRLHMVGMGIIDSCYEKETG